MGTAVQAERTACPKPCRCAVACWGWVPEPRLGDKQMKIMKGSTVLVKELELGLEGYRAGFEGYSAGR